MTSSTTGLTIILWGMSLLHGCQLDFVLPIFTLWAGWSTQFFSHHPVASWWSPYLPKLAPGLLWQTMLKTILKSSYTTFTALPLSTVSCCLLKGKQIGQAWFTLGRSMLAFPHHLLILHVLGDSFQEDLFNNPLRDWLTCGSQESFDTLVKMGMTFDFLLHWELPPITMTFHWVAIKYDCTNSKVLESSLPAQIYVSFFQNYIAEGWQQMEQLLLGCHFYEEEMSGRSRKGELWRAFWVKILKQKSVALASWAVTNTLCVQL